MVFAAPATVIAWEMGDAWYARRTSMNRSQEEPLCHWLLFHPKLP
jgi:hypothetical protein